MHQNIPIIDILERRDENSLLLTIQKNINFFYYNNIKIAQSLHNQLQGGNTKFQLLFNANDINIIDLQNKQSIFPKNYLLTFSISLANNPLNNKLWKVYSNNLTPRDVYDPKLHITTDGVSKIAKLSGEIDSRTFHLPQFFLPQTNIFGLCSGIFLQILLELGYNFHSLLIFEQDIELFCLSCYFVDYEHLFNAVSPKSCYIFIKSIDEKMFLKHYFYSKRITNNFLRLELSVFNSKEIELCKSEVYEAYRANSRGWGSFEDELIGVKNALQNTYNNKVFFPAKRIDSAICVVGSGPSLESNISFLKNNENNMVIFSCGTALKVLRKYNIKVDFQIEIERIDYLSDVLNDAKLESSTLLAACVVDCKVVNLAKDRYIFLRGGSSASHSFKQKPIIELCGPFVGNAGVSIAAMLSDCVILCGIDCGYIEGKAKHAKGSYYGNEDCSIPPDAFEVKGNGKARVYSNSIFSLSREVIEMSIKHYKPKFVYNISDGAFIKGTIAKNPKLEPINKLRILEEIKSQHLEIMPSNLKDSLIDFCHDLSELLTTNIATKQELFAYIDKIGEFLLKNTNDNPGIGILFEGSISHLLQSMLVCGVSIKNNNISEFSNQSLSVIRDCVEKYKEAYLLST